MKYHATSMHELDHVRVPIEGSTDGLVTVLDTGAIITAEDQAMTMALYSRSPDTIDNHLRKLGEVGSGKFMQRYYVGYGHGSIGDCGNTAVFAEGVSMLAAKAIQDSPLYSGQECSTRYIDFSEQPFFAPDADPAIIQIYNQLRSFYIENLPAVIEDLTRKFPDVNNEGKTWRNAIEARAFDIMRGFLPAGATTNVAWNTNLRQARDHLATLRNHPLEEVRNIATSIEHGLVAAHPHSFNPEKRYVDNERYISQYMSRDYYLRRKPTRPSDVDQVSVDISGLDTDLLRRYHDLLNDRPPKSELPKFLGQTGTIAIDFNLDFGSFRDIQRHRASTIRMPLHTTDVGFESWYLHEMPEEVRAKAELLLVSIEAKLNNLNLSDFDKQYLTPMGYMGACAITGGLPAIAHMLELRSTSPVHETLRRKVTAAADELTSQLDEQDVTLPLHLDRSEARFDTRRGSDTITEVEVI